MLTSMVLLFLADDDGSVHSICLEAVDPADGIELQLTGIHDQHFYQVVADGITTFDAKLLIISGGSCCLVGRACQPEFSAAAGFDDISNECQVDHGPVLYVGFVQF